MSTEGAMVVYALAGIGISVACYSKAANEPPLISITSSVYEQTAFRNRNSVPDFYLDTTDD